MRWNVNEIFDYFNGPDDLHAALEAKGFEVTVRAVRLWKRRQNIPSNWIAAILYTYDAQSLGVPMPWYDFEKEDEPEKDEKPEMEDIF